ncbi:MAG: hypothetical protein RLZZ157_327 [Pseudomonadota bacterium]|jgi:hypothetical protein
MAKAAPRLGKFVMAALFGAGLLLALLAFVMRDNLFRALIEPRVPFQVDEQPPAPDYTDAGAWAVRPQGSAAAKGVADIFFVHPTTAWSGAQGWNAHIDDPVSRTRLERVALPNHGEPFAAAGTIWAPRYRQAVLYASLARREDSREALNFAYQDVARAFAIFQQSRDHSRPLILAGVGQGGLHVLRLLQSVPDLGAQISVAYLIDQPVPQSLYAGPTALAGFPKPCDAANATACFVSYTSVDDTDARGARLLQTRTMTWTREAGYQSLNGAPFACVNPLTGSVRAPDAPASANRGSAAATGLERGTAPPLLPGETGAVCRDSLLAVEPVRPASLTGPRFELGTFYKLAGYNLFYAALSQDAKTRVSQAIAIPPKR